LAGAAIPAFEPPQPAAKAAAQMVNAWMIKRNAFKRLLLFYTFFTLGRNTYQVFLPS
jgi:hypothetical protein